MINLTNLGFRYPSSKGAVFTDFNLTIPDGCVCGLLGKNGEGKTTLLHLVTGLLRPQHGTADIDGIRSSDRKPELLQDIFLVGENVEMPAMSLNAFVKYNRPFYPNFSDEILNKAIEAFELPSDPHFKHMSMGQAKKAYIAFALATNTRYLIMDEPTNGLDIPSKAQLRKILATVMTDERTMIISTHQVHDIETLLDHVVILHKGQTLLNESVEEICKKYVFEYRQHAELGDAIYSEPTLQGYAVMAPRGEKAETPLNIELLFNALTSDK